jgi:hypothetical protein
MELWIPIKRFGGLIEASSHGHIRTVTRTVRQGRGVGHERIIPARLLKPRRHPWGYGWVEFMIAGTQHAEFVHRLVAEAFFGPCPEGQYVLHGDNDPANSHIDNLRYGTPSENCEDKLLHGTQPHGEGIPWSKLTETQVVDMRARRASGEALGKIAADFGVTDVYVWQITTGRKWSHARGAITPKVRKVRLLTEDEERRVLELRGAGKTIREIAETMGVSRTQVHNRVKSA